MAAAAIEPSPFTATERAWIASKCSALFGDVKVNEAPPLDHLRDNVALVGLAENRRKFVDAVDPRGKKAREKLVAAVRHVARPARRSC